MSVSENQQQGSLFPEHFRANKNYAYDTSYAVKRNHQKDLTFKKLRTEASSHRPRSFLTSVSEDDSSGTMTESLFTATFLSPTVALEDVAVFRRAPTISRERNWG